MYFRCDGNSVIHTYTHTHSCRAGLGILFDCMGTMYEHCSVSNEECSKCTFIHHFRDRHTACQMQHITPCCGYNYYYYY